MVLVVVDNPGEEEDGGCVPLGARKERGVQLTPNERKKVKEDASQRWDRLAPNEKARFASFGEYQRLFNAVRLQEKRDNRKKAELKKMYGEHGRAPDTESDSDHEEDTRRRATAPSNAVQQEDVQLLEHMREIMMQEEMLRRARIQEQERAREMERHAVQKEMERRARERRAMQEEELRRDRERKAMADQSRAAGNGSGGRVDRYRSPDYEAIKIQDEKRERMLREAREKENQQKILWEEEKRIFEHSWHNSDINPNGPNFDRSKYELLFRRPTNFPKRASNIWDKFEVHQP